MSFSKLTRMRVYSKGMSVDAGRLGDYNPSWAYKPKVGRLLPECLVEVEITVTEPIQMQSQVIS